MGVVGIFHTHDFCRDTVPPVVSAAGNGLDSFFFRSFAAAAIAGSASAIRQPLRATNGGRRVFVIRGRHRVWTRR